MFYRMCCVFLSVVIVLGFCVLSFCSPDFDNIDNFDIEESEVDIIFLEDDYSDDVVDGIIEYDDFDYNDPELIVRGDVVSSDPLLYDIWELLYERLPEPVLGVSDVSDDEDIEHPPALHLLMPMARGIGTQFNYPYTGGGFLSVNTNYGNGVILVPEPFKIDTFGFLKNSDRVFNLTNSTVSGYFVMGNTTYDLQFTRYGEPQYRYYTGSTWTWRTLNISKLNDSNIQFLDETGERGIQRPVFTWTDRLLVILIVIMVVFIGFSFVRGGFR